MGTTKLGKGKWKLSTSVHKEKTKQNNKAGQKLHQPTYVPVEVTENERHVIKESVVSYCEQTLLSKHQKRAKAFFERQAHH